MLGGLYPGRISLVQHAAVLAAGRRARHPRRLGHPARPGDAAAADRPGPGRRAASPRSPRSGIAIAASSASASCTRCIDYMSAQSWFPQSGGVALPGVTELLAFLIIIGVLFWRGARIPGRGELVERRLPEAPRPQHLWRTALIAAIIGAVLLVVFPYDFREALINTLIGAVMALSLVVITGYVGQISVDPARPGRRRRVHGQPHGRQLRHHVPARRPGGHRRRRRDRRDHRDLGGAGPRRVASPSSRLRARSRSRTSASSTPPGAAAVPARRSPS